MATLQTRLQDGMKFRNMLNGTLSSDICSTSNDVSDYPDTTERAGKATMTRRTVLPWLVVVQENGESLDIPESGTWKKISAAHRDMIASPRTASGLSSAVHGQFESDTMSPWMMSAALLKSRSISLTRTTRSMVTLAANLGHETIFLSPPLHKLALRQEELEDRELLSTALVSCYLVA